MSVPEQHEASFRWPHQGANDVIVTGDFDAWSCAHHLSRTDSGKFEGKVPVPWGRKVAYKYIVDGRWTTTDDQPTEWDPQGFVNNVYNAPARPAPPEPSAPEAESPAAPEGTGIIPNVISSVTNAAVAMVEAIAPGTTETLQPTPAVEDEANEVVLAETAHEEVTVVESAPPEAAPEPEAQAEASPAPAPEEPTPHQDITAEAVLPQPAEQIEAAPVVPVPVLPLAAEEQDKQLETTIVEGTATSQPEAAVEPSTHTPVDAPVTNGHAEALETTVIEGTVTKESEPSVEASTHVPAPSTPETVTSNVTSNGTLVEPSTHTPAAPADKAAEPTTSNGVEAKPEAIALPQPTPAEVPLPETPAANGNGKATPAEPSSSTTTPQTSPRKDHKRAFPSFGKHRRSSSITSTSTHGADEHGVSNGSSPAGTQRKKRNSIFGKIRDIFSDAPKKTHA
ncbi:carbohydrate-binding module family 48 protein [Phanerochaete sordida]|uniref:Carbohydrate-binding module family 48 protein n=1 Tax=Phanerochaete sordida TaxID=48140 RepID=A0A9P3L8J4_9APHY|nr:carbohydrate-binding module family 48 protein [Phanerochaete sordida]